MIWLAAFAKTTLTLIAVCVMGVTGEVETLAPYRDTMVAETRHEVAFAFGGIIFNGYDIPGVVAHEYGHTLQERELTPVYLLAIGLPSLLSAWKSPHTHWQQPYEIDATMRGAR